jgi:hypothetical protein
MPHLFSSGNRNLVIVRAGRASLHPAWLAGAERARFDLLVTAYEEGVPAIAGRPDVATLPAPGRKIAGFDRIFTDYPELLDDYERIALLDDDLETDAAAINRVFDIGESHGLRIWQPALTPDSYFSYAVFLQNTAFTLRYTNFIEMMCPFFAAETLREVRPLFALGLEVSIDLLWCRCFDAPWFKCAVIDAVAVKHSRPVGSTAEQQGFSGGRSYDDEMAEALEMFGTTFRGPVVYAGITPQGRLIGRPGQIALHALGQIGHWSRTPMGKPVFLRRIADHVRHCLTRPVNLGRVEALRDLGVPGFPARQEIPVEKVMRRRPGG